MTDETVALLLGAWNQGDIARIYEMRNAHVLQPDGYLTDERKAADPDEGFSTFFSETGTVIFKVHIIC